LERRVRERTASLEQASEEVKKELVDRAHMERQLTRTNELLVKNQTELLETLVKFKRANEELKSTQQQLFQVAKLESVGRMAAGVAHEVKNPLATLLIGIEHLVENVPMNDGNLVLLLQDMQRAVRKADSVIKGLLDFSAPEKLETAPEEPNAVVEQALVLMKHEFVKRHIALVRELAPNLPRIRVDRSKVEQVLVNLMMNASHAMPDGGAITIRTAVKTMRAPGAKRGRRAENLTRPEGTVVAIEVDDTGSGIPEEALAKIFDPFFTTKPTGQGTGLGLTVSRKIVELHGGTIDLKNKPGGGIRATLLFNAERSDGSWTGNGSSSSTTK
jgi:signal transduction histidine kinase